MATLVTYGNLWARDYIQIAAAASLVPLTHCAGLGIEPAPPQKHRILNPMCHSRNSLIVYRFQNVQRSLKKPHFLKKIF